MEKPGMKRREFIRKAGLSAMSLAALPGLGHQLATPVLAKKGGRIGFIFAALSKDFAEVDHKLFMTGNGSFGKKDVKGGGSYIHFDLASPGYPKVLLETGTWRAKRLIKWTVPESELVPYGEMYSGILDLEVLLFPEDGPRRGVRARMAMI